RFPEDGGGAHLERLRLHRHVPVTRDDDDRGLVPVPDEETLKLDAARAGHGHVEDEAVRLLIRSAGQKSGGGRERTARGSGGPQEPLQSTAYRRVVVQDSDERPGPRHRTVLSPAGTIGTAVWSDRAPPRAIGL